MAKTIRYAAVALAGAIIATAALAQNAPSDGEPPNAARGAELFVKVGCYQCHGLAAHGGVAPKLGPRTLPWVAIAAYIRNPAGVMPPYAQSVLSDRDVMDIAAWLQSVPESPEPSAIEILPPVSDIPAAPRTR